MVATVLRSGVRTTSDEEGDDGGGVKGGKGKLKRATAIKGRVAPQKTSAQTAAADPKKCCDNSLRTLFLTHISICLYIWCFFIQTSTRSFGHYVKKNLSMEENSLVYLYITVGSIQCYTALMFGRFGDVFGGRATLKLPLVLAALSYGVLTFGYSLPLTFYDYSFYFMPVLMLPSVFRHAMLGGQIITMKMTEHKDRAGVLAKLSMTYGLGMIAGPHVGELVNSLLGETLAALAAYLIVLTLLILIHVLIQAPNVTAYGTDKTSTIFGFGTLFGLFCGNPRALLLLFVKIVTSGFPMGFWEDIMEKMAIGTLGMEVAERDSLIVYLDLFAVVIHGLVIGILSRKCSENRLIKAASVLLTATWFAMSYIQSPLQLTVLMMAKYFGLLIMKIITTTALINTVPDTYTGTMLGMLFAVDTFMHSIAPPIGRYVLQQLEQGYFGLIASIFTGIITLVIFRFLDCYQVDSRQMLHYWANVFAKVPLTRTTNERPSSTLVMQQSQGLIEFHTPKSE